VWNGTGWGCRTVAITGQLSITSVPAGICCGVLGVFDSYSRVQSLSTETQRPKWCKSPNT
jgi:hypothetical protein